MSKRKRAKFHLGKGETLLKQGMMDYAVTGQYRYFAAGDATLTDRRFYFYADLSTGEVISFDLPLGEIYAVEKIGIPFLTRSMRLVTDRGSFRLNAFFVGRWVKAVRAAIARLPREEN